MFSLFHANGMDGNTCVYEKSHREKPVSDAKLFAQIKKKYFKGKSTEEILEIMEQALTTWFAGEGVADV